MLCQSAWKMRASTSQNSRNSTSYASLCKCSYASVLDYLRLVSLSSSGSRCSRAGGWNRKVDESITDWRFIAMIKCALLCQAGCHACGPLLLLNECCGLFIDESRSVHSKIISVAPH
mmetsp:Transcript_38562/g.66982  ORF Transcript_38562/g.66982 Transcript_38562/m.66982 type:complete len:117 (-) Transcript_38562:16-366(-)